MWKVEKCGMWKVSFLSKSIRKKKYIFLFRSFRKFVFELQAEWIKRVPTFEYGRHTSLCFLPPLKKQTSRLDAKKVVLNGKVSVKSKMLSFTKLKHLIYQEQLISSERNVLPLHSKVNKVNHRICRTSS